MKASEVYRRAAEIVDASDRKESCYFDKFSCLAVDKAQGISMNAELIHTAERYASMFTRPGGDLQWQIYESPHRKQKWLRVLMLLLMSEIAKDTERK